MRQVITPLQRETHARWQYHRLSITIEGVLRLPVDHSELDLQLMVRTLQGQGICRHGWCFGVMLSD